MTLGSGQPPGLEARRQLQQRNRFVAALQQLGQRHAHVVLPGAGGKETGTVGGILDRVAEGEQLAVVVVAAAEEPMNGHRAEACRPGTEHHQGGARRTPGAVVLVDHLVDAAPLYLLELLGLADPHQGVGTGLAPPALGRALHRRGGAAAAAHLEVLQAHARRRLRLSPLPGQQQRGFRLLTEEGGIDRLKLRLHHLVGGVAHLHAGQPGGTVALAALHQGQAHLALVPGRLVVTEGEQRRQTAGGGILFRHLHSAGCRPGLAQGAHDAAQLPGPELQAQLHEGAADRIAGVGHQREQRDQGELRLALEAAGDLPRQALGQLAEGRRTRAQLDLAQQVGQLAVLL